MNRGSRDDQALPLKEAIQQEFADESLSDSQLQQLLQLQDAVPGDDECGQRKSPRRRRYRALAACAILLLAVALLWQTRPYHQDNPDQIAVEVVKNHLKLKPLDVSAQSMGEVRAFFTQLDFSPVNSELLSSRFQLDERSMLGGRYCSIGGITAAQLRYRQDGDSLSTLYQVPYERAVYGELPDLGNGEQPLQITLKGLRVSMWVEMGLLMVLVQES
jgi:hypothetical protein